VPLLYAVDGCSEGVEVEVRVDVEVTTVGLSEVLAPKSRVEKNVAEGLGCFWVDMMLSNVDGATWRL
jgi:hypothetical protein